MTFDTHQHLVKQGWGGKGTALRHGAISRPVVVAQKKTLSGIGKDRDEAFPFWDHVFTAAVSSIKIKVYNSDDSDSEDAEAPTPTDTLQRTKTGIISNRRPVSATPADSGTATPNLASSSSSGTSTPRMSVISAAKQQAARKTLYSMFFRGPVLGSDVVEELDQMTDKFSRETISETPVTDLGEGSSTINSNLEPLGEKSGKKRKRGAKGGDECEEARKSKSKHTGKRTSRERHVPEARKDADVKVEDDDDEQRRKRRREEKRRKRQESGAELEAETEVTLSKEERNRSKKEKRARKEEKRRSKAEKQKLAQNISASSPPKVSTITDHSSDRKSSPSPEDTSAKSNGQKAKVDDDVLTSKKARKKSKRKDVEVPT